LNRRPTSQIRLSGIIMHAMLRNERDFVAPDGANLELGRRSQTSSRAERRREGAWNTAPIF
jgi:hypothetical protein